MFKCNTRYIITFLNCWVIWPLHIYKILGSHVHYFARDLRLFKNFNTFLFSKKLYFYNKNTMLEVPSMVIISKRRLECARGVFSTVYMSIFLSRCTAEKTITLKILFFYLFIFVISFNLFVYIYLHYYNAIKTWKPSK